MWVRKCSKYLMKILGCSKSNGRIKDKKLNLVMRYSKEFFLFEIGPVGI